MSSISTMMSPFTLIPTIVAFILCLFVRIQLKNHKEVTKKELKHLKSCTTAGIWLFIPNVIQFAFCIILLIPYINADYVTPDEFTSIIIVSILNAVSILPSSIILAFNLGSRKIINHTVVNENISVPDLEFSVGNTSVTPGNNETVINNNIADKNQPIIQKTDKETKSTHDFYALLISLLTLPTQLFLCFSNLSAEEVDLTRQERLRQDWGPSTRTEYYFPDEIKSIMIILAFASLIGSMFLILRKGKNTSNKATWVKIINFINVIGQIILFMAINLITA